MKFTTVNRIISKLQRDLGLTDINEGDIIEWAGEALGFIKAPALFQQNVAFMKVAGFEVDTPSGFQSVLQIKRYRGKAKTEEEFSEVPCSIKEDLEKFDCGETPTATKTDDCGCEKSGNAGYECKETKMLFGGAITTSLKYCETITKPVCGTCATETAYRPYFDMRTNFVPLLSAPAYVNNFSPVALSEHVFFNTLVCKEIDQSPYQNCEDEYTLVGDFGIKIRFSFKEGYIALAYIKNAIDEETGYPLVPDHTECLEAIGYYVQWKIAQRYAWSGREGYAYIANDKERLWLKYVKQARSDLRMPGTIDQMQNLLNTTHYLVPQQNVYENSFSRLGKKENRSYLQTGAYGRS